MSICTNVASHFFVIDEYTGIEMPDGDRVELVAANSKLQLLPAIRELVGTAPPDDCIDRATIYYADEKLGAVMLHLYTEDESVEHEFHFQLITIVHTLDASHVPAEKESSPAAAVPEEEEKASTLVVFERDNGNKTVCMACFGVFWPDGAHLYHKVCDPVGLLERRSRQKVCSVNVQHGPPAWDLTHNCNDGWCVGCWYDAPACGNCSKRKDLDDHYDKADLWCSRCTKEYLKAPANGTPVCRCNVPFIKADSVVGAGTTWWHYGCYLDDKSFSSAPEKKLRPSTGAHGTKPNVVRKRQAPTSSSSSSAPETKKRRLTRAPPCIVCGQTQCSCASASAQRNEKEKVKQPRKKKKKSKREQDICECCRGNGPCDAMMEDEVCMEDGVCQCCLLQGCDCLNE